MSARFNLSSEMFTGNSSDDNKAYVEIVLDIFDDTVAIHSIQGGAALEDLELCSLVNKITLENRSSTTSSSVDFSLFEKTCWHIKKVSEGLKLHAARLTKGPLTSGRFHQTKSAAAHALKGLKFI